MREMKLRARSTVPFPKRLSLGVTKFTPLRRLSFSRRSERRSEDVCKGSGGKFMIVFPSADTAVNFSVDVNRALLKALHPSPSESLT